MVDALLGTGVSGALREPIRSAVELARQARAAGVPVVHELFAGQIHGFLTMGRIVADSRRAIALGASALKQSFAQA